MEHGERAIGVLADFDAGLDVVGSGAAFGQLQVAAVVRDGVVAGHDALLLDAQDLGEACRIGHGYECAVLELRRVKLMACEAVVR